ncbi:hypothetical protein [Micromonospora sp. WMMC250]|uniref:hypothetical protein n=1 Tax=Micromonospora sp. WMMC250 TaxID=3014781 RepID=UPI0022B69760|nr:hypothetical protein [Micromonospora sp. WMMC250]MCZ7373560.1 hypothetical protein [Micromonospora sp. WMMC250]
MKWWAIVVAALTVALCLSGNVLAIVLKGDPLPLSVNLVAISTVSCALVLTVVAEIQERLDDRISALTEFLVARLNEIETHTGDRNTGFVEGYLMWQGQEAKVVPIRSRQADRSRPAP